MSDDLLIKKRIKLIQRAFTNSSLDRDGVNVSINCVNKSCSTFSRKEKRKLCLRVDNEFYHCWVCGLRGRGLANFFRKYARAFQAPATELFHKNVKEKDQEPQELVELPSGFKLLSEVKGLCDPDLKACRSYALNRGISNSEMWYFKLGAVPGGRFRRRVIIPSFDDIGNLNYYTARSIDESTRKYMNPKVTRSDIIFNEINLDWSKEITIVEGPFDLFKCNQNATCLLGSTINEKHKLFKSIVRNLTPVLLALDKDAKKKTQDIAFLLSTYDVPVRIMNIGAFNDVGEMTTDEFKLASKNAVAWSRNNRLRSLISTIKSGSII